MIHTTHDIMRSMLFQTFLSARYWAESLHSTTDLLNLLLTKVISAPSPYFAFFDTTPSYSHLHLCHHSP
jgi:hypothetical protein